MQDLEGSGYFLQIWIQNGMEKIAQKEQPSITLPPPPKKHSYNIYNLHPFRLFRLAGRDLSV
jgi:hypothetical protein